ncbi:MAG: asparaginase [Bdellovibrionales bacterium]
MTLPKILTIFCGGTISMHKGDSGSLEVAYGPDQFFRLEPRMAELAQIDVCDLINIDSSNIRVEHWDQILEVIETRYNEYDGFLVTIGTNTMAYTASALSFALQHIGKPVVMTGAQIPAEAINTDGRNNLVNAFRLAGMNVRGVYVVFGSKIMLGCRSKKLSESELDAFGSFNDVDFAEINIGIKFNKDIPERHTNPPQIMRGFNPNILCLTCIPGIEAKPIVRDLIDRGYKGIIMRGYGSADISEDMLPDIKYAQEKKVPIVVTTQCRGSTVMGINDPGFKALQAGVVQAFDMSMESMSTKMMWLLAQNTPYESFKKAFHTNMCGEINIKKSKFFINKELASLSEYRDVL